MLLSGCSGLIPHASSGFVPPSVDIGAPDAASAKVTLILSIPTKGASGGEAGTLSPSTQSVKISITGGAKNIFNVSSKSPGCKRVSGSTRCKFRISAGVGSDTLTLDTFGKANGHGPILDGATATMPISGAKASITIGSVVTNTSDHGPGSLRQSILDAGRGDTVVFAIRKRSVISLAGPLKLTKSVNIAGPGSGLLTISGKNASQIVTVSGGVIASIFGATLTDGAAAATTPLGGAIYNGGTLKLDSDVLSSNEAVAVGNATAKGIAGLGVPGRFDPRPRLRGSKPPQPPHTARFSRPHVSAQGEGGAIYNAATLIVTNTTFTRNTVAQGSGGAIYNASTATLTASSSTFVDNAGAYGGAVADEGTATLTADTFKANIGWPGAGAPISGAYGYGAAIYSVGALTIDGCTFTSNVAGGNISGSYGLGGAIAEYGGSLAVTNTQFSGNIAGGGTNGSSGRGGAIYSNAGTLSLGQSTFQQNMAGGDMLGYGGAVFAANALAGTSNIFNSNVAYGSASGGFAYGGAVYAQGALTLSGGSFAGNSATGGNTSVFGYSYGGALDIEGGSTLSSIAFTNNQATGGSGGSAQGGAVFVNGGSNKWTSLTLSANTAMASGAQSYAAGGAVMMFSTVGMTGTQIASNSASASTSDAIAGAGGGIAVVVGPLSFAGTLSSNTATTQGGGIWLDDSATISQSTIAANRVTGTQNPNDGGGGIYDGLGASLTLTGSTLSGNSVAGSAASSGGGGMFNAGLSAAISNSTFSGNTSSVDGGGIENEAQGGLSLVNVTVYQNSSPAGKGGNVKNLYSDASMSLANTIVAGGSAATGSDVSNDGTIVSQDYNIVQTAPAGTALSGTTTHNLTVNPLLLALASNGGPTQTNADQAASPGTAHVPYSVCVAATITTDQRGYQRGAGGFCDVGSYEFSGH